ncbi:hypothetical protein [Pontibacter ruber]|uniref:hypothetical protein n=1 Tax=Pontibacter ruber TaxID=1343895 RepID=UPI00202852BA|nr:hypothetical protein [Pontibacter ruber]
MSRLFFALALILLAVPTVSFAGKNKYPNTLKTGVSYAWLSEYDSEGLMFYTNYNNYFGDRFAIGFNVGALNASRYDKAKQIYTVKNNFYMGSLDATYDLLQNDMITLRIGGGPALRHRGEVNANIVDGTPDGSVRHVRASDIGVNGYIENDFNFSRFGVMGGRVAYHHYSEGTPVFSLGFHVGFKF